MNFKLRVKENIGAWSEITFGKVGTIIEIKNGTFKDKESYEWTNDRKYFKNEDEFIEYFKRGGFETEFELVEEKIPFEDICKGLKFAIGLNSEVEEHFKDKIKKGGQLLYLKDYQDINVDNIQEFTEWISKVNKYVQKYKQELEKKQEMTLEEIEEILGHKVKIIE